MQQLLICCSCNGAIAVHGHLHQWCRHHAICVSCDCHLLPAPTTSRASVHIGKHTEAATSLLAGHTVVNCASHFCCCCSCLHSTFCKFGRSTLSDPAKQVAAADCLPKPGHGLQLKQGSFDFTFDQLQAEATARQLSVLDLLADLPMDECPAGSFSAAPSWAAGLDAAAKALAQTCQPCANGAATTPGSSGAASCSAAGEGSGRQRGTSPCMHCMHHNAAWLADRA